MERIAAGENRRIYWADVVRAVAIFLVVLAHVNIKGDGAPWIPPFYYVLSRMGVPFFFMLSGYLLLQKQEPIGIFFLKRVRKVLVPFVIWSVIYMVFWNREFAGVALSVQAVVRSLIRILRGPRANHLWFFYALFGLYLITPVLRVLVAKGTRREVLYLCGVWLMAGPVLAWVEEFTVIRVGVDLRYVTGYLGYFLLGYFLGGLHPGRRAMAGAALLHLLGFGVTFWGLWFVTRGGQHRDAFESYLSLGVVMMSLGMFMLLRWLGERTPLLARRLAFAVSRVSFGVYLIHVMVMDVVVTLGLEGIPQVLRWPSALLIPLTAVVVLAVSSLVVRLMQRVPLLRYAVP